MADLSLVEYSATSIFISILPNLEELKESTIPEKEKVEKAKTLIIKSLCKARSDCNTTPKGIGQDYIINVNRKLNTFRNINQIISYINNAINKGKTYNNN